MQSNIIELNFAEIDTVVGGFKRGATSQADMGSQSQSLSSPTAVGMQPPLATTIPGYTPPTSSFNPDVTLQQPAVRIR